MDTQTKRHWGIICSMITFFLILGSFNIIFFSASQTRIAEFEKKINQEFDQRHKYYVDRSINDAIRQGYWIKYNQKRSDYKYEEFYSEKIRTLINSNKNDFSAFFRFIEKEIKIINFEMKPTPYKFVMMWENVPDKDTIYSPRKLAKKNNLTEYVTRGIIYQLILTYKENTDYINLLSLYGDFDIPYTFH